MPQISLTRPGSEERIALRGVRLVSHLAGMSQRTRMEQTFVNQETHAVEATYTFPLPDDAAVCDFEILTDDRVLTGMLEDRDRALSDYDEALEAGDAAFMLEQDRPDVFTVRVGSLKPGQAVTVRFTYTAPLHVVDGTIRLVYPTTIAPRYISDAGMDPLEALIDGAVLNPPRAFWVPYGVSIEVEEELGLPLESIASPSHEIEVTESQTGGHHMALTTNLAAMDRDIVLQLQLAGATEPHVQLGSGPDDAIYAAVTFMPEFDVDTLAAPPSSETVFLLDCSASMGGESIEQACRALDLCLRSMSQGDYFNIIRFGSDFEQMEPASVPYTQQTLDRAVAYVAELDADLDGTELFAPLQMILAAPPQRGRQRQVIVLTDGQVSNEPGIIRLAKQFATHNRIFMFGIGPASSKHLVNGLAQATGGMAEFITSGERIEDKVLRTFSRIASPAVENIRLDWHGASVQLAAEQLPPICDGDVCCTLARVTGSLPNEVTLRCDAPQGEVRWSVPVVGATRERSQTLATAWARCRIGAMESASIEQPSNVEIVALSKKYNVLCAATAFLAVERRSVEERDSGRPPERRIPVMLAHGWGGMTLRLGRRPVGMVISGVSPVFDDVADQTPRRMALRRMALRRMALRRMALRGEIDFAHSAPLQNQPAAGSGSIGSIVLPALLRCQVFSGQFDDIGQADGLATMIEERWGGTLDDARTRVQPLLQRLGGNVTEQVTDTLLAIVFLHSELSDETDVWDRAFKKAVRWLQQVLSLSSDGVLQLLDAVQQKMSP